VIWRAATGEVRTPGLRGFWHYRPQINPLAIKLANRRFTIDFQLSCLRGAGCSAGIRSRNLAGVFRLACWSLKYFPERILAGDLPLSELKQVNPPHFDVLP
jgi:hypothetical protein